MTAGGRLSKMVGVLLYAEGAMPANNRPGPREAYVVARQVS